MPERLLIVLALSSALLSGCQSLSLSPPREESAQSHYQRGQILLDRGNYDAALEELAKAISVDPQHAKAQTAIGDIYRRKGDHALAATHYQLACQADPYAFKPHYDLGVTYQVLADAAADAVQAGEYLAKAVSVYIRALAIRPENFDSQLNLGACYYQLGKYRLAEDHTRKALTLNPRSTRACNNLAFVYIGMNDPGRAILMFKRSLELDSSQPEVLQRLGLCYLETRRPGLALGAYRAAQKMLPNSPDPWTQMGVCYFRLKKFDDAMAAFQNALRLDRRHPPAYRGIGVVCIYHYVIDNSRTDLLQKGLLAWKYCLKLQPGQQDLQRLVDRYTEIAVRRGADAELGQLAPPEQPPRRQTWQPRIKPNSPRPKKRTDRPKHEPAKDPLAPPEPPATARKAPPDVQSKDPQGNTSVPLIRQAAAVSAPVGSPPMSQPRPVRPDATAGTDQSVVRKTAAPRPAQPIRTMPARPAPVDRRDEPAVAGPEPIRAMPAKPLAEPVEAQAHPEPSRQPPSRDHSPRRKSKVLWTDPPPLSESLSRRDPS